MLKITSSESENIKLYGLMNKNGDIIIHERCHKVFKINECMFGYRVGLRWGLVSSEGKIISSLILRGYYEWTLKLEKIENVDEKVLYNQEYNCRFIEEDLTDYDAETNEAYIIQKDIEGNFFIIDLEGKVLLHEMLDNIWKVDMTNHFVVFKNNKGNLWNCRNNKYLLEEWIGTNGFHEDEYGIIYIQLDDKKYKVDSENTNTDIVRLISVENNSITIELE